MTYADGRYGALDIGTVTCRLLVADVEDGRIIDVDKEYAITDLGVGVDATGRLSEAAIERVLACVDRYLEVLARYDTPEHPVRRLIAMATSASRDAANGPEFAARLAERGITLAVIPGSREAQLTFLGASSDFPGENLLVVDIGGGSTEVVAGRFGEDPVASHSFNIGCRRVTERFFRDDPPTPDQMDAARQRLDIGQHAVEKACGAVPRLGKQQAPRGGSQRQQRRKPLPPATAHGAPYGQCQRRRACRHGGPQGAPAEKGAQRAQQTAVDQQRRETPLRHGQRHRCSCLPNRRQPQGGGGFVLQRKYLVISGILLVMGI